MTVSKTMNFLISISAVLFTSSAVSGEDFWEKQFSCTPPPATAAGEVGPAVAFENCQEMLEVTINLAYRACPLTKIKAAKDPSNVSCSFTGPFPINDNPYEAQMMQTYPKSSLNGTCRKVSDSDDYICSQ